MPPPLLLPRTCTGRYFHVKRREDFSGTTPPLLRGQCLHLVHVRPFPFPAPLHPQASSPGCPSTRWRSYLTRRPSDRWAMEGDRRATKGGKGHGGGQGAGGRAWYWERIQLPWYAVFVFACCPAQAHTQLPSAIALHCQTLAAAAVHLPIHSPVLSAPAALTSHHRSPWRRRAQLPSAWATA